MAIWRKFLSLWSSDQNGTRSMPTLAEAVDLARRDWLYAQTCYHTATDPDLIDYAIFLAKAYERRYMYLLRKARQEGVHYPGGISVSEFIESATIRRVF